MKDDDDTATLFASLFDAALDDRTLLSSINAMGTIFNAPKAGILYWRRDTGEPSLIVLNDMMEHWEAYESHYWQHDIWLQAHKREAPPDGTVVTGAGLVPPHELRRSVIYNELMTQADIGDVLAVPLPMPDNHVGVVTFWGRDNGALFQRAEMERLDRIVPTMQSALRLRWRMRDGDIERAFLTESVEGPRGAWLLVGSDGGIKTANRDADALLSADDGLARIKDALQLDDAHAARAYGQALNAATPRNGAAVAPHPPFRARRPSGRSPYVVEVTPLRVRDRFALPSGRYAVVSILDTAAVPALSAERLRALFDLTEAESRLACALADGVSLSEAAARRGVAVGTARQQLKAVFRKTETHSQAELLRVLDRLR